MTNRSTHAFRSSHFCRIRSASLGSIAASSSTLSVTASSSSLKSRTIARVWLKTVSSKLRRRSGTGLLMTIVGGAMRSLAGPTTAADTPEGFQHAYNAALKLRDAAAMRSLFVASTPGERAVVDVFVKYDLALDRLAKQIEATFGTPMT